MKLLLPIEAVQFNGIKFSEEPEWLKEAIKDKRITIDGPTHTYIKSHGNYLYLNVGEYVTYFANELSILTEDDFKDHYKHYMVQQ